MRVDHPRFDVLMAPKLLDGPDIVTAFQKFRGQGMPERVTGGPHGPVPIGPLRPPAIVSVAQGLAQAVELPRAGCRGRLFVSPWSSNLGRRCRARTVCLLRSQHPILLRLMPRE